MHEPIGLENMREVPLFVVAKEMGKALWNEVVNTIEVSVTAGPALRKTVAASADQVKFKNVDPIAEYTVAGIGLAAAALEIPAMVKGGVELLVQLRRAKSAEGLIEALAGLKRVLGAAREPPPAAVVQRTTGVRAGPGEILEGATWADLAHSDPEVDRFARLFEQKYPGRAYQTRHSRPHSDGRLLEIDFETDNAIIEFKGGNGAGLTRQIIDRMDPVLNPAGKVCIGVACSPRGMSRFVRQGVEDAGGLGADWSQITIVLDSLAP